MSNLVVAALFLLGTHFGISSTHLREQLISAAGERAYLALYSLISFVAIVMPSGASIAAPPTSVPTLI